MNNISENSLSPDLSDKEMFELLYRHYWQPLLIYAGRYIDDQEACKEIVQELFISLHLKRSRLHIHVSLSAYLFHSLKHKALNYLRKESVYKKHIAVAGNYWSKRPENNDVEEWMDIHDLEKQIFDCLNRMPLKYREVYLLNKHRAFSVKVTAKILNRPVDTVEKQLRKAVHQVQAHLNNRKVLQ